MDDCRWAINKLNVHLWNCRPGNLQTNWLWPRMSQRPSWVIPHERWRWPSPYGMRKPVRSREEMDETQVMTASDGWLTQGHLRRKMVCYVTVLCSFISIAEALSLCPTHGLLLSLSSAFDQSRLHRHIHFLEWYLNWFHLFFWPNELVRKRPKFPRKWAEGGQSGAGWMHNQSHSFQLTSELL